MAVCDSRDTRTADATKNRQTSECHYRAIHAIGAVLRTATDVEDRAAHHDDAKDNKDERAEGQGREEHIVEQCLVRRVVGCKGRGRIAAAKAVKAVEELHELARDLLVVVGRQQQHRGRHAGRWRKDRGGPGNEELWSFSARLFFLRQEEWGEAWPGLQP
jgi:hypothetical protein